MVAIFCITSLQSTTPKYQYGHNEILSCTFSVLFLLLPKLSYCVVNILHNFFWLKNRKSKRSKIPKPENTESPKDGKPASLAAAALDRIGSSRGSPLTVALYSSMSK